MADSGSKTARLLLLLAGGIGAAATSGAASAIDVFPDTAFGNGFEPCTNLECTQVVCGGGQTTSISGTVFAPNGTLPLPNVEVYVPNATVGALVDGPNASRCDEAPLGHPIAATLTDANGNFTLRNVPATSDMPLVLLAGKWRTKATIQGAIPQCANTALAGPLRLPRNHNEGDIPHIAVVTGNADSLECLIRKTGVDDAEFTTSSGTGRIHLFAGNGASAIDGGGTMASATTLWANSASLSAYDQVMLGCEGSQQAAAQPQTAVDGMKAYADSGGRVYLSHWQNLWIGGQSGGGINGAWPTVATWSFNSLNLDTTVTAIVNGTFAQGATMVAWLFGTGASVVAGSIVLDHPRQTAITVDESLARKWISQTTSLNVPSVPHFSFTTPVDASTGAQHGRVVFVDLHGTQQDTSASGSSFPSAGCHSAVGSTTAQEKALLYATFDLQRCVGSTKE